MTKEAASALRIFRDLIAEEKEEAWIVGIGDFPDNDLGPDDEYEKSVEKTFLLGIEEIGQVLKEDYLPLSGEFDAAWTPFKVAAWEVSDSLAAVAFLYRDDWDTPLTLQVGICKRDKLESTSDPWNWLRKEAEKT